MIVIKHNDWRLKVSDDNSIVAERKLTADELGHELLVNNQVLETDEFYLIPEKNEDGHIVFYRVPKD